MKFAGEEALKELIAQIDAHYSAINHKHTISDITDLSGELNKKANVSDLVGIPNDTIDEIIDEVFKD